MLSPVAVLGWSRSLPRSAASNGISGAAVGRSELDHHPIAGLDRNDAARNADPSDRHARREHA